LSLIAMPVFGQPVDEAARTLAKKVAARLEASEAARVTGHNLTALPAAELSKAQTAFTRGLRRTGKTIVEITLTISESANGLLLIAETKRGSDSLVDMTTFEPTAAKPATASRPVIQKTLLWEQDDPVLDLVIRGEQMWVLEPGSLVHYKRDSGAGVGKWQRDESHSVVGGNVRDPRGQIGESEQATLLGPGNTFPGPADGGPAYYTRVHWRNYDLATEPDGLVHIYDAGKQQVATIDNWGSDLAATACGVLATGPGDAGASADAVTAWELVDRRPRRISESLEFPGPVTALWPRPEGALAVVRDAATKKYAAYLLTLDCGR